ncbi:MAG: hypothetical protein ACKO3V_01270, partial [Pirellula sp.]
MRPTFFSYRLRPNEPSLNDPSAIKEDAMVDLNRRLQAHQQIVPYRFLVAIAFLASLHTAIFQTASLGLAQEPRKPSWMPFPMGRASNNFTPANPTPTSPAPPAQAG